MTCLGPGLDFGSRPTAVELSSRIDVVQYGYGNNGWVGVTVRQLEKQSVVALLLVMISLLIIIISVYISTRRYV